jgi:hypothetical protein
MLKIQPSITSDVTPSTAFSTSHPAPSVLENKRERETDNEETTTK